MTDPEELLELAVTMAKSAGDLLLDGLERDRTSVRTKSSRTDMVTEMDLASEKLVAESLYRQRPLDSIVGEEGTRRDGSTGVRWIVDPLDGTTNYLHRFPAFAVSIAAEIDGRVAVGVVHDPSREETFAAVRGGGARVSKSGTGPAIPLQVPMPAPELDKALVGTGFNYDLGLRADQAAVLTRVLPAVRDIRRAGSSALDLCWVAAGRIDACVCPKGDHGVERPCMDGIDRRHTKARRQHPVKGRRRSPPLDVAEDRHSRLEAGASLDLVSEKGADAAQALVSELVD
jgi:myo-inositol-1(or 4)-monophosphatase